MRECEVNALVGTTGTGKSTAIVEMLKGQKRALIFPANNFDPAWSGYKPIKPRLGFIYDKNDFNKSRRIPVYRLEELHTFTGIRVLDVSELRSHTERMSLRDSIISIDGFIDGALVFDDFKNWIPSKGSIPGVVRSMLGDMRHKRTDIILATHALNEINAEYITFLHNIYLFRTTLPPNKNFAEKMGGRFDELVQLWKHVNHVAATKNKHYCRAFNFR